MLRRQAARGLIMKWTKLLFIIVIGAIVLLALIARQPAPEPDVPQDDQHVLPPGNRFDPLTEPPGHSGSKEFQSGRELLLFLRTSAIPSPLPEVIQMSGYVDRLDSIAQAARVGRLDWEEYSGHYRLHAFVDGDARATLDALRPYMKDAPAGSFVELSINGKGKRILIGK